MREWRPMTWVILVINLLFLVWIIGGVSSTAGSCAGMTGDELDFCEAGTAIGASVAVGAIIFLWAAVDLILGILWLVTGRSRRDCPTCGKAVKKGQTVCRSCGHDFAMHPATA